MKQTTCSLMCTWCVHTHLLPLQWHWPNEDVYLHSIKVSLATRERMSKNMYMYIDKILHIISKPSLTSCTCVQFGFHHHACLYRVRNIPHPNRQPIRLHTCVNTVTHTHFLPSLTCWLMVWMERRRNTITSSRKNSCKDTWSSPPGWCRDDVIGSDGEARKARLNWCRSCWTSRLLTECRLLEEGERVAGNCVSIWSWGVYTLHTCSCKETNTYSAVYVLFSHVKYMYIH